MQLAERIFRAHLCSKKLALLTTTHGLKTLMSLITKMLRLTLSLSRSLLPSSKTISNEPPSSDAFPHNDDKDDVSREAQPAEDGYSWPVTTSTKLGRKQSKKSKKKQKAESSTIATEADPDLEIPTRESESAISDKADNETSGTRDADERPMEVDTPPHEEPTKIEADVDPIIEDSFEEIPFISRKKSKKDKKKVAATISRA